MKPSETLEKVLRFLRRLIPRSVFEAAQPLYHYLLALAAAVVYRFPSRKIKVIAVTGTKGKTTTVELVSAMLEAAKYKTAIVSTLKIKIADKTERNLYKMSTPGRFFLQRLLREALNAGCTHAILEITSEAAKLRRHRFINFDALVFTGIHPEHIESHGSFEKYLAAKLSLGRALSRSSKRPRIVVANSESPHSELFLGLPVEESTGFTTDEAKPYTLFEDHTEFTFDGVAMTTLLPGLFNLSNIIGAAKLAKAFGAGTLAVKDALGKVSGVAGRMERVVVGQPYSVIVDYAHTPDSLEAVYKVFPNRRKICVLGSCGGGRDVWKRPEMGQIADKYCGHIILTNEDPYDEDPENIIDGVAAGISGNEKTEKILNRRDAIARALSLAGPGDVVLITGKGTDPFIMGPNGTKEVWSDKEVAALELEKLTQKTP